MTVASPALTAPAVQTIIDENYGPDKAGFYPMNKTLSEKIVALIEKGKPEDGDRLQQKVMVLIWNNYDGGDNAEHVARRIFETFNLS